MSEKKLKLQKLRSFLPLVEGIVSQLERRNSQNEIKKLEKMRQLQKFIISQEDNSSKLETIDKMIRLLEGIQKKDSGERSRLSSSSSIDSATIHNTSANQSHTSKQHDTLKPIPKPRLSERPSSKASHSNLFKSESSSSTKSTPILPAKDVPKPRNESATPMSSLERARKHLKSLTTSDKVRSPVGNSNDTKSQRISDSTANNSANDKFVNNIPILVEAVKKVQSSTLATSVAHSKINSPAGAKGKDVRIKAAEDHSEFRDKEVQKLSETLSEICANANVSEVSSNSNESLIIDNLFSTKPQSTFGGPSSSPITRVDKPPSSKSDEADFKAILENSKKHITKDKDDSNCSVNSKTSPKEKRSCGSESNQDSPFIRSLQEQEVNDISCNTQKGSFLSSRAKLRRLIGIETKSPSPNVETIANEPLPGKQRANPYQENKVDLPKELSSLIKKTMSSATGISNDFIAQSSKNSPEIREGRTFYPNVERERVRPSDRTVSSSSFHERSWLSSAEITPNNVATQSNRNSPDIREGRMPYSNVERERVRPSDRPVSSSSFHERSWLSSAEIISNNVAAQSNRKSPDIREGRTPYSNVEREKVRPSDKPASSSLLHDRPADIIPDPASPDDFGIDTPHSPELEEILATPAPSLSSPVKTIPTEKIGFSRNNHPLLDSRDRQSAMVHGRHRPEIEHARGACVSPAGGIGYRYEKSMSPAFHKHSSPSSHNLAPSYPPSKEALDVNSRDIPKPLPLPTSLPTLPKDLGLSPLKNNTTNTSGDVGTHSRSLDDPLTPHTTSSTSNTSTAPKSNIKVNKPGGALNIEEYRKRRQQRLAQAQQKTDATLDVAATSSAGFDQSRSPYTRQTSFDNLPERSNFSQIPSLIPPQSGNAYPSHLGKSVPRMPDANLQAFRDPRASDKRLLLPGPSEVPHHSNYHSQFHGYSRPGSNMPHYPADNRNTFDSRNRTHPVHQGYPQPLLNRHNQHSATQFRDYRHPQSQFNRPPGGYNVGSPHSSNPYAMPVPFQGGAYGVNSGFRAPSSPTPPPLASVPAEPAKKISETLSKSFTCVMMKGLPCFANSVHIYKFLQDYILKDVCIALDHELKCTGDAYVNFPNHDSAADCVKSLNGYMMNGFQIILSPVAHGFYRSAKDAYEQKNIERERRMGIAPLPRGNCNPFYDPKKIEEKQLRIAMKKAESVLAKEKANLKEALGKDPGTATENNDENFDYNVDGVELPPTNATQTTSPVKPKEPSKTKTNKLDATENEVNNKKNRRYRKIVVASDSEDENVSNNLGTSVEDEKPPETVDKTDPKLDEDSDSDNVVASQIDLNEFSFPDVADDGDEPQGADNDLINTAVHEEDDLLEFEDDVCDNVFEDDTEDDEAEENLQDINTDETDTNSNMESRSSTLRLRQPKIKSNACSTPNTRVKNLRSTKSKPKKPPTVDDDLSFVTKMTRNTQFAVEKVCPNVNRLKVSIPKPKKMIFNLFNEKNLHCKGKRGNKSSFEKENTSPILGTSDANVTATTSTVSKVNAGLMSPGSTEDPDDRDCSLVIDLGRSRADSFNQTMNSSRVTSPLVNTPEKNPTEMVSTANVSSSLDSRNLLKEVSVDTASQVEGKKNKTVTSQKESNEVMVAEPDSTIQDDESIVEKCKSSFEDIGCSSSQNIVADSSQGSSDELEILQDEQFNTSKKDSGAEPPETAATSPNKISEGVKQQSRIEVIDLDASHSSSIGKESLVRTETKVTIKEEDEVRILNSDNFYSRMTQPGHDHSVITLDSDNSEDDTEKKASSKRNADHLQTESQQHKKLKTNPLDDGEQTSEAGVSNDQPKAMPNTSEAINDIQEHCKTPSLLESSKNDIFSNADLGDDADMDISQLVPSLDNTDPNITAISALSDSKSMLSLLDGKPIHSMDVTQPIQFEDKEEDNMDISSQVNDMLENLHDKDASAAAQPSDDRPDDPTSGRGSTAREDVMPSVAADEPSTASNDVSMDDQLAAANEEETKQPDEIDKASQSSTQCSTVVDTSNVVSTSDASVYRADDSDDDSESVDIGSISSFPDDVSVVSGESRDSKTPDSGARLKKKRPVRSKVEARRVTRGSIVEKKVVVTEKINWDDGGIVDLFQCDQCDYVGRQHVNHVINYHSETPVKCAFKKEDISVVYRDKVGPPAEGLETSEQLDLSWVPDGLDFENAVKCVEPECGYISSKRFDLLYHYVEHYPKGLNTLFHCRLCHHMTNDMEVSYNHFTSHTGEYRYNCTKCGYLSYCKERMEEHNTQDHDGAALYNASQMVLDDSWPYIHICKLCLFTQIQFSKAEAHNVNKHNGKAEIARVNMFRNIILHANRNFGGPKAKPGKKGKKLKQHSDKEKKIFVGNTAGNDEGEEVVEAKLLVDRISQNIYTTRTAGQIKLKIHQLDKLHEKLQTDDKQQDGNTKSGTKELNDGVAGSQNDAASDVNKSSHMNNDDKASTSSSDAAGKLTNETKSCGAEKSVAVGKEQGKAMETEQEEQMASNRDDEHSKGDDDTVNSDNEEFEMEEEEEETDFQFGEDSETDETFDTSLTIDPEDIDTQEMDDGESGLNDLIKKLSKNIVTLRSTIPEPLLKPKHSIHKKTVDRPTTPLPSTTQSSEAIVATSSPKVRVRSRMELVDLSLHNDEQQEPHFISCCQVGCGHKCSTPEEMVKHEYVAHGPYKCSFYFCNFVTPLEEQFVVHYQTHPHAEVYGCGYACSKSVGTVQDLISHYKSGSCPNISSNSRSNSNMDCSSSGDQSTFGLKIESVSTIDPSSAARLFGSDRPFSPEQGKAIASEHPTHQSRSTTLFPSVSIYPPSSPTNTSSVSTVSSSNVICSTSTPQSSVVSLQANTSSEFVLPPGFDMLPSGPPTVPILFVFQQYQTVTAFKTYTGKRSGEVFKCMYRGCVYSTNDTQLFTTHAASHGEQHRCCYCMLHFNAVADLVSHILEEHSHCGFMCKQCLYRSASTIFLGSHMKHFHPDGQPRYMKVTTINKSPPPNPPVDKFILAYCCGYEGCERRTVDADAFKVHVTSTHGPEAVIKCFLCPFSSKVTSLVEHMRSHMMDEFQCPYCLYGEHVREKLTLHLVNCHPGRSGKVLLRKQDQAEAPPAAQDPDQFNAGPTDVSQSPAARLSRDTHPGTATPSKSQRMPSQTSPPSDASTDILSPITPKRVTNTPNKTPSTQDGFPLGAGNVTPSSDNALKRSQEHPLSFTIADSVSDDINTASDGLPAPRHLMKSPTKDGDKNESSGDDCFAVDDGASMGPPMLPSQRSQDADATNADDETTLANAAEKSDLYGHDLYCCGNLKCTFSSGTLVSLREHLQICDYARDTPMLRCYHCNRQFRHVSNLLEHIKVHGPKRYHCAVPGCTYRATMLHYFRNHTKQMHGTAVYRYDVKDPTVKDPEKKEFLVFPKDATVVGKETHKKRKNEYGVNELDRIPPAHVSYTLLRCYHCQFASKIRLNLVKHLNLHLKFPTGLPLRSELIERKVEESSRLPLPNKQPVNPVPCLKNKELMFDKMMNLAGSSFEEKKKMEEVDLRLKNPIPQDEFDNLPAFVPDCNVNVCGVEGCQYTSINETMLKHHIRALHSDVTSFPCKHCKNVSLTVEKISAHFKLHGERLYRCGWCPYLSFRKAVAERHTREKHPSKTPFEFIIRDPDEEKQDDLRAADPPPAGGGVGTAAQSGATAAQDAASETSAEGNTESGSKSEEPQWMCGLCTYKSVTQQAMVTHTSMKHDVKSQYKCGHCNFRSSVMTTFDSHYEVKHVNMDYRVHCMYYRIDAANIVPLNKDLASKGKNEPIWKRNNPDRTRKIRGILLEDSSVAPKVKTQVPLSDIKPGLPEGDSFVCPKCLTFKNPSLDTFRSHLCKEADYHRYECSECRFTTSLLPSLRRHFNVKHHSQFHSDSYLVLPVDQEKEAWVESIISHQQHHMRLQKQEEAGVTDSFPTPSADALPKPSGRQSRRSSRDAPSLVDDASLLPPPPAPAPSSSSASGHKCLHCGLELRTASGLASHIRANHVGRYKCGHCPFAVDSLSLVGSHSKLKHPELPANIIDSSPVDSPSSAPSTPSYDSDASSSDVSPAKIVATDKQQRKVRKCPDCPFETVNKTYYYKHCKSHIANRPFLCIECNLRFRDNKGAKQHARFLHGKNDDCIKYSPVRDNSPITDHVTDSNDAAAASDVPPSQDNDDVPEKPYLVIDEEFDELPDLESTSLPIKKEVQSTKDIKPFVLQSKRRGSSVAKKRTARPLSKRAKQEVPALPVHKFETKYSATLTDDSIPSEDTEEESVVVQPPKADSLGSNPPTNNKPSPKVESVDEGASCRLEDAVDKPGVQYTCCHCSHSSERPDMIQHMRSEHVDLQFIVRKTDGECMWVDIYNYSCDHCDTASISLDQALKHWMKHHVILNFKFSHTLKSSQLISGNPQQSAPPVQASTPQDNRSSIKPEPSADEHESGGSSSKKAAADDSPAGGSEEFKEPQQKKQRTTEEEDEEEEGEVSEGVKFRCGSCRRTSNSREVIRSHQKEKHCDASWRSVIKIDCTSDKLKPSNRRLVKCVVCGYIGSREQVSNHCFSQHPYQTPPYHSNFDKNSKFTFRCDVCQYCCKSRKVIVKHINAAHSSTKKTFSRYALETEESSSSLDDTKDSITTTDTVDDSTDRKYYRCDYCHEICCTLKQLKDHHAFLHSHLPLTTPCEVGDEALGRSRSETLSSARPQEGVNDSRQQRLKSTARKSTQSFSDAAAHKAKRDNLRRSVACKSTKRKSFDTQVLHKSKKMKVIGSPIYSSEDELPNLSPSDSNINFDKISALINFPGAGLLMLGFSEINTLFDINPIVVLTDIKRATQS